MSFPNQRKEKVRGEKRFKPNFENKRDCPKTLKKLEKAGIRTIEDLKTADLDELARKAKISVKRLRKFVAQIP